jgi:tRNA pseudouridine38-40 synthase
MQDLVRGMQGSRNIKLVIEYDGTHYRGWQVQPNGPTIQEEIEKAINRITQERVRLFGAGRTDAGVHALGQVANFSTTSRLSPESIRDALNGVLPRDIAVLSAEGVDTSFHARYSARSKHYRYRIFNRGTPSPLERNYALFCPVTLDVAAMNEAGQILVGTQDFSSFGCNAGRNDNPVRTVLEVASLRTGECVVTEIEAVSFLYKMARSIMGMLIEVGKGKLRPVDVVTILDARDRSKAGATAPAHGLYLVEVRY